MKKSLFMLVLMLYGNYLYALELSMLPAGDIYLNATDPGKGYSDLVLHTLIMSTDHDEVFQLEEIKIELTKGDLVLLSKIIQPERAVSETQGMAQMASAGLEGFLNAQILSQNGFSELFERQVVPASSTTLGPNELLMITRQHFSLDFVPERLTVSVAGVDAKGEKHQISSSADVAHYQSAISYTSPLQGAWLMTSLPSIQSHHRLNPTTEFAVDFFRTNEDGRINEGDALDATGFFGFGADVLAAADGEVVFIVDDETQDRAAYLPKPGESPQQTAARVSRHNMQRYATNFRRAAAGNIVTIRHEADGKVEYSSYGHLKSGSVRVSVGDTVRRGQPIAEVGDTGDSAAVHLHFQLNTEADVFASKSLPVTFSNLDPVLRGVDPGRFVQSN